MHDVIFSTTASQKDTDANKNQLRDLCLGLLLIPALSDEDTTALRACVDLLFYNIDILRRGGDAANAYAQIHKLVDFGAHQWPTLQPIFQAIGQEVEPLAA